ncbi:mediator of DNA damage checkpoint protein 1-like [Saccostrea echinata]|uniref:mediator of DNA damage checkpoint protein 1-like n=1 Tax=Saccostrea echinata TaxID=191078 RepID=UPI002A82DBA3|nr:mediator of DNA damage checkpoint protein 1-like [Saccostrea echinata]
MPGVSSRTPRRRGPPKTPEKTAGLSTAQFYSPKTPGWVSGNQMKFELEESPLNNVRKGRKSVIPTGTATQKTTNSRRHTMFKLPEPVRSSPIGTRSRRSSIFNVHSRKGGIRLTIAVTPQEKLKKGPGKVVSPPGVKTRTRRSSVYQKGKTLQEACSQVQKTVTTGQNRKMTGTKEKEETAVPKKPVSTRRSVNPKSPERPPSRTSLHGKISSPQSNNLATKRKSIQPSTTKSEEKDENMPAQKKLRKTPRRSVTKSAEEPKVMPENVEAVFKTPARLVSSASEDTQPVSTKRQRSSVKKTPVSQASKSLEDVKPNSPKRTPTSIKRKTPAQSASKQLRSATKRKSRTPALSRSTRQRNIEQSEDDSTISDTDSKVKEPKVTLTPKPKEDIKSKSPKSTVKRKMDLPTESPQVKVKVTEAVLETSSGKSRHSSRKAPAKVKSSVDDKSGDTSLDESIEFKTPMKTPRLARSAKKTTKLSADMTPQVKLTKISLPNEDAIKEEESKIDTQENQDGNSQKTVQVVSPELSSPAQHSGKLAERRGTPARVQPDAADKEVLLKGKNKKESKIKKLKTKEKANSAVSLNGSLNTSAHTSMGAKCTIL